MRSADEVEGALITLTELINRRARILDASTGCRAGQVLTL
jgi:hypothetical protein